MGCLCACMRLGCDLIVFWVNSVHLNYVQNWEANYIELHHKCRLDCVTAFLQYGQQTEMKILILPVDIVNLHKNLSEVTSFHQCFISWTPRWMYCHHKCTHLWHVHFSILCMQLFQILVHILLKFLKKCLDTGSCSTVTALYNLAFSKSEASCIQFKWYIHLQKGNYSVCTPRGNDFELNMKSVYRRSHYTTYNWRAWRYIHIHVIYSCLNSPFLYPYKWSHL